MERKLHLIWNEKEIASVEDEIALATDVTARHFRPGRRPEEVRKMHCFVLTVLQGEVRCAVDGEALTARRGDMVVVLRNADFALFGVSDDLRCHVLLLSESFLSRLALPDSLNAHLSVASSPCITLGEEGLASIDTYLAMMSQMMRHADNPYRLDCLRALTEAFFFGAGYYLHLRDRVRDKRMPDILTEQFLQLLSRHGLSERTLSFYADRLCVSPKYLSACVGEVTGTTALRHIQQYVVRQADRLLCQHRKPLADIAHALGFPSTEAFSHYYRRATGLSPSKYRSSKHPRASK